MPKASEARSQMNSDPPHTRQSQLILAAFRPWGGSWDERRTGGRSITLPIGGRPVPRERVAILADGGFA